MQNQKAYRITIFSKEVWKKKISVTQVQFDNDLAVTLKLFETQKTFSRSPISLVPRLSHSHRIALIQGRFIISRL